MPAADAANPPLTWVSHAWRLVVCLGVSALAWWDVSQGQWHDARAYFWIDLAMGVASYVLMFFRRRWPVTVAMVTGALSLVSASSSGASGLAFVSLATHRKVPQIAAVGVVSIVCSQLFFYYQPNVNSDPPWVNFTVIVVATVALAAIGMYIGSRRELVWTLRERARQAESEQALRVDQARSAERERIAREMHDVLAHRISLVAMHSGALAFRTDLPPEQVRETAQLIQAKSHEALADLRQVLGMLRGEEGPNRPQPTLANLPELVEEATASGLVVDLRNTIRTEPPEQIGRTVYRIVQEALTNARKHGGGSSVRVRVGGRPGRGIAVVVRNGKRFGIHESEAPPSGLGLVGLRERAELSGGRIDIEENTEWFALKGWLPWPT